MTDIRQEWQTIEQAAITLKCSVRTINRRLVENKLQSRLENGRREVFVPVVSDGAAEAAAYAATETAGQASAVAAATPATSNSQLMLLVEQAAEKSALAVRAYQTLATQAEADAERMRLSVRWAWAAVAVMAFAIAGAMCWTTWSVTHANERIQDMSERVRTLASESENKNSEVQQLQGQLSDARSAQARAQGQLAGLMQAQMAETPRPTTQPTLVERLASVFEGH